MEDPHNNNVEVDSKHECSCWSLGKGLRLKSKKAVNIHHPVFPFCGAEPYFFFLHKILKWTVMVKAIAWWHNLQRIKITLYHHRKQLESHCEGIWTWKQGEDNRLYFLVDLIFCFFPPKPSKIFSCELTDFVEQLFMKHWNIFYRLVNPSSVSLRKAKLIP